MMVDKESFWEGDRFVVVTDNTKPAMKLTIEELRSRGKDVHVVDISDDAGKIKNPISKLPSGIRFAVVGVTKADPALIVEELKKKGIENCWIHWRTDTPAARKRCSELNMSLISGRCPMMYLSRGFGIHSIHRSMAKLIGRY
jgi:chloramphenicol 3-O-phosphotransferase